jgi:hypothetical protein
VGTNKEGVISVSDVGFASPPHDFSANSRYPFFSLTQKKEKLKDATQKKRRRISNVPLLQVLLLLLLLLLFFLLH